jgi:hypothetical protein
MPPIENIDDQEIDRDDLGAVSDDEDDIRNIIAKALADQKAGGGNDEDEPSLEDLPETKENPAVSVEEGISLIEKAGRPEKPAAAKAGEAQADQAPEAKPAEEEARAANSDDMDGLLEGLDADRAQKIRDRIAAGGALSGLLTERKDQLSAIAETPEKAVENLLHLHNYANQNPDQYLAWAAWQLGGENAAETLTKAAAHLGLKVVKAEDEDPFEDDRTRQLRAENEALRMKANGGRPFDFGPDVQPATPPDPLAAFKAEKGSDGKPLRPLWDDLAPIIGQRALQQRTATGVPVTTADLAKMYDEEVGRLAQKFRSTATAASQNPLVAAQSAAPVANDNGKKPAATALDRARAASNHIDGEGQGADRHSAPPPDGSIADLIRYNMRRIGEAS